MLYIHIRLTRRSARLSHSETQSHRTATISNITEQKALQSAKITNVIFAPKYLARTSHVAHLNIK